MRAVPAAPGSLGAVASRKFVLEGDVIYGDGNSDYYLT